MFSISQQLDLFPPAQAAAHAWPPAIVLPPQSSASYHRALSDALENLEAVWAGFYRVLEMFDDAEDDEWRLPELEMLHEVQERVTTLRAHWPGLQPWAAPKE